MGCDEKESSEIPADKDRYLYFYSDSLGEWNFFYVRSKEKQQALSGDTVTSLATLLPQLLS